MIFCKFSGLFLRIFLARVVGTETLGIYMMILPTIGLLINLSQAGVPTALLTLSSKPNEHLFHLFLSATILCIIQLIICIFLPYFFKDYFSVIYPYFSIIILFIIIACASSLFRTYYLGKEQAYIPAISQIVEEIIRLFTIFYFYLTSKTLTLTQVFFAMLLGEMSSCLFMFLFIKRNTPFTLKKKIYGPWYFSSILSISLPTSGTALIRSFQHSIEPYIFRYCLLNSGYTISDIHHYFGLLNGQILGLLMIPSFLNSVIYKMIFPKISKSLSNRKRTQTLIIKSLWICLFIGIPISLFFYFFPNFSLQLFFSSDEGAHYLKYLAIPFIIYYIQTPLQAYLQASRQQLFLLAMSITSSVFSIFSLFVLLPQLGPGAYIFSFLIGLILNTILSFILVYRNLFFNKE